MGERPERPLSTAIAMRLRSHWIGASSCTAESLFCIFALLARSKRKQQEIFSAALTLNAVYRLERPRKP